MIEQGRYVAVDSTPKYLSLPLFCRLRAWIDQVERTIFFEGRSQDEEDIQGTAGGLGIEKVEKPIQGITLTERWDERIKETSLKVSSYPARCMC